MPTILGANTESAAYEVSNSLRFNDDDSPKVSRSISSSGSARNATLSVWVKRGNLGTRQQIYSNKTASSGFSAMNMYFNASNDRLYIDHHDGSSNLSLYTTQVFRDVSAWYHIVHTIDTTTATATNRLRLYINGTEVTDFATDNNPSQNADLAITNSTGDQSIGDDPRDSNDLFDGYMAEFNFVDGTTLDPTYFGETNSDGIWVPKEPNVSSYGTNGFYLEFKQTGTSANSSGIGADTSGNDNHMSVTNLAATDVTTDTPTNNFNTLNSLANQMGGTLSEGGTQCVGAAASDKHVFGTFGLTKGKWYWEVKITDQGARGSIFVSDSDHNDVIGTNYAGHSFWSGGTPTSGTSNSTVGSGASDNDIICFAVDLDNGKLDIAKNGNIDTSGTAEITGLATSGTNRDYRISQRETGNPASTMQHNYGNAPFSISSSNSDANGHGSFEYAVPSGYFALCTKNLAEFG